MKMRITLLSVAYSFFYCGFFIATQDKQNENQTDSQGKPDNLARYLPVWIKQSSLLCCQLNIVWLTQWECNEWVIHLLKNNNNQPARVTFLPAVNVPFFSQCFIFVSSASLRFSFIKVLTDHRRFARFEPKSRHCCRLKSTCMENYWNFFNAKMLNDERPCTKKQTRKYCEWNFMLVIKWRCTCRKWRLTH